MAHDETKYINCRDNPAAEAPRTAEDPKCAACRGSGWGSIIRSGEGELVSFGCEACAVCGGTGKTSGNNSSPLSPVSAGAEAVPHHDGTDGSQGAGSTPAGSFGSRERGASSADVAHRASDKAIPDREKKEILISRGWVDEGKGRWHHPDFDDDKIQSFETAWFNVDNVTLCTSDATDREVYMVLVGPYGDVFVKALDFFRSQGGFNWEKDPWGKNWKPVVATSVEGAREKGCALPGAKPYERQAK